MSERAKIYALGEAGLQNIVTTVSSPSGTGGSGMGGLEARVAKIEASMEHVEEDIRDIKSDVRGLRTAAQTDFRLIFGAIIFVALGLAGIMAHGFKWF